MTDIIDWPPNYADIVRAFPAVPLMRPIFSWGEDIYNPHRVRIDAHLRRHEGTHSLQHAEVGGPVAWWARYLDDAEFRLAQELAAYRVQLASFARVDRSRERRHRYAFGLAQHLSSPMYGSLLAHPEALRRITS